MALEMRGACEKCNSKLEAHSLAFICTHECTFCEHCTSTMDHICPNCSGELVKRPRPTGVCPLKI
jgi:hypothetical protein